MHFRRAIICVLSAVSVASLVGHKVYFAMTKHGRSRRADGLPQNFWSNDDEVVPDYDYGGGTEAAASESDVAAATADRNRDADDAARDDYVVYASVHRSFKYVDDESVTLATHGGVRQLWRLLALVDAWDGPITVAVYAPASDFYSAYSAVLGLRDCSRKLRYKVTFYMFYHRDHPPQGPSSRDMSDHCSPDFRPRMTYLERSRIEYPAAKAANIAKRNADSRYVIGVDIDLLPNRRDLMETFVDMLGKRSEEGGASARKVIYVLPVFVVELGQRLPQTKRELNELLAKRSARVSRVNRCSKCRRLPDHTAWFQLRDSDGLNATAVPDWVTMAASAYIGHRDGPLTSLKWDELKENIHQVYELCRAGYAFHMIDNAWLMHTPRNATPARESESDGRLDWHPTNVTLNDIDERYNNVTKPYCRSCLRSVYTIHDE
ncbi:PREDICTED: beta-1,4-glucuronyltransferase 1-like [Priapulus caudatus]|uniref:Beta-1,4-glucuronyltransferase 1-like n=1 Tax=Priapulus caudatus TaxID=37621 RepID=A0ABM1EEL1_PRICU|nr:PREDICTED: beta-1,4-glucuronyltransferase 1-like [Priapulus caudatus]